MLVRTWNLFHGNTKPPGHQAHLQRMVRLATQDHPDLVCLQEVPVWGLPSLAEWSGMQAFGSVARHAPLGAGVGKAITALHPGVLRSALNGQANAILVRRGLQVLGQRTLELNPLSFRRREGAALGLSLRQQFAWAKERRMCQALRVRAGERTLVIGNLHASAHPNPQVPDFEVLRAATFVDAIAAPKELCVLAGDFNLTPGSPALRALAAEEWGFSQPGPWLDHVLVRGASSSAPITWPRERRELAGALLSDHAPVEVTIDDL